MKRVLVAGATGLVGSALVQQLLAHPQIDEVHAIVRSHMHLSHPKFTQKVVNFDQLENGYDLRCEVVCCCLGTTMAKAGSQQAFIRVDHDYPLALARQALAQGAQQFILVSALGADAQSKIFYSRVKGQVEEGIRSLGYPSTYCLRPSFLTGARTEQRLGEAIGIFIARLLSPLLLGPLRKYRPIAAEAVARGIVRAIHQARPGHHIITSDHIATL